MDGIEKAHEGFLISPAVTSLEKHNLDNGVPNTYFVNK